VWEVSTRIRQRVIPRQYVGARPDPHVPTGWTSLVSLGCVGWDGVQVIPWGSVAGYTMRDHRGAPHTKVTYGGRDGLRLPLSDSRAQAAASMNLF